MRLTLRTLLAYLDGTLDPQDAADLAKRIEESDFARDLVHRIRDCTKRLRLGAPRIDGRAAGLDPNTVADYLDNTLPAGRVPDFEKVCLESDVHLAEVAACHQILAMVLSTPAMLDPQARQRMYDVINAADMPAANMSVEQPDVESLLGIAEPPAVPLAEASALARPEFDEDDSPRLRRKRPEVPDYLRESSRSRWWAVAATVLVAAGLTALVIWLKDPVIAALGLAPEAENNSTFDNQTPATTDPATEESKSAADTPRVDPTSPADPPKTPASVQPDPSNDAPPPKKIETPPVVVDQEPDANAVDANTVEKGPPVDAKPGPVPDETVPPSPDAPTVDAAADDPRRKAAARPIAEAVGKFVSEDQILLRHDRRADQWVRLATGAELITGDRLVALPLFRPKIMLNTGVTVMLVGPAVLELHPARGNSPAGVTIVHGQLAQVAPVARAGIAIHVRYGQRAGMLTFPDTESSAALECYRFYEPGADPMTADGPITLDLIATSGQVTWQEDGAAHPDEIAAGNHRLAVGASSPRTEPLAAPPAWITSGPSLLSEQSAIKELKQGVAPGEPIDLVLEERISDRRREVRLLAGRNHPYIGRYAALVARIRNENENWEDRRRYIEYLRTAIQIGPAEAKAVHDIVVREFGDGVGAAVYRLLYGYSAKELEGGQLARLVDLLSHDSLVLRALSFYNLQNVAPRTSQGVPVSFGYKPEDTEVRRRTPTQKWKEKLRTGMILAKETPKRAAPAGTDKPAEESPPAPEPGVRLPPTEPPAEPTSPTDEPKPGDTVPTDAPRR
jgi:hypothetical protein